LRGKESKGVTAELLLKVNVSSFTEKHVGQGAPWGAPDDPQRIDRGGEQTKGGSNAKVL